VYFNKKCNRIAMEMQWICNRTGGQIINNERTLKAAFSLEYANVKQLFEKNK
jgi:hypothetical protein